MHIRRAILLAANRIANRPDLFNFWATDVPEEDCGSPGCALGWVRYYTNKSDRGKAPRNYDLAPRALKVGCDSAFYARMYDLDGHKSNTDPSRWTVNAAACAQRMREYADRYHPLTSRSKR